MEEGGGASPDALSLFGRDRELARVAAALADVRCNGILFIGPAGVGKSRLAEECRLLGEESGMATAAVFATPVSAQLPLGALAAFLPAEAASADLQPVRLLQLTRAALAERAGGRRLLLLVDDGHCLDPVGAHLIAELAGTGAAFVVMTVRAGEPTPDPLTQLWKDGVIDRVDVTGLDRSDAERLATALIGGVIDPVTGAWLHRTSAGNPLFLRELVLGGVESGSLRMRADGRWTLVGTPVTPRLADLVDQRLRGLDGEERRALELVAVAEPIGLDLAERLIGADRLEQLDRHGLVDVTVDGARVQLRVAHPLYSEVLRHAPLTLRRRNDLQSLIEAIRGLGARRRDDPVRIATWQLEIGGRADPAVLLRAALAAQYGNDEATAERLARTALEHRVDDRDLAAELGLCQGTCLARLSRFADALEVLDAAKHVARDPDVLARIALRTSFIVAEGCGDAAAGEAVISAAIADLPDGPWMLPLHLHRLLVLADTGRIGDAAAALAGVEVPAVLDPSDAVLESLGRASTLISLGLTDRAANVARAGYQLHSTAADLDSTFHPLSQAYNITLAHVLGGRIAEAEEAIDSWFSPSDGRLLPTLVGGVLRARIALVRGRPLDARAALAAVRPALHDQVQPYVVRWLDSMEAWAFAISGDHDRASEVARRVTAPGSVAMAFSLTDEIVAAAEVHWLGGRQVEARNLLEASGERLRTLGHVAGLTAVRDLQMHRFGSTAAARDLLSLARTMEGPLSGARVVHAEAVLDGTAESIGSAGGRWKAIGYELRAAELYAAAAASARHAGSVRDATRWELAADEVVRSFRGASLAAVVGLGATSPLTDREREIAVLVARGRSSREVADQLVVSIRTVDNHLQRVYAKLGISSRRELAAQVGAAAADIER